MEKEIFVDCILEEIEANGYGLSPASRLTAKLFWEQDPRWQPLRQFVERLLVTYDWGEALLFAI
jgi:toluene monooxygenase system protein E